MPTQVKATLPQQNVNLLFIDKTTGKAYLKTNSENIELEDTAFSRWFLRVHFTEVNATKEGREWFEKANPLSYKHNPHLLNQPTSYQKLGLCRMAIGSCCLWLDMGLGKTFLFLAHCLDVFVRGEGNVFLIVCPVSVFVTWQDELLKHCAIGETIIAHGPKKFSELRKLRVHLTPLKEPYFILTSYETLGSLLDDLKKLNISVIAFDESSRIKTPDTLRTKAAHELAALFPEANIYLLSGTPSTKDPLGFYSQYEILGEGKSGSPNFVAFKHTYAIEKAFIMVKLPNGKRVNILEEKKVDWLRDNYPKESTVSYMDLGYHFTRYHGQGHKALKIIAYYKRPIGFKNLDQLRTITKLNAYSLRKEDVLKELPAKTFVKRTVEMSKEQKKAYNEIVEEARTLIQESSEVYIQLNDRQNPITKLHQIANGYVLIDGFPIYFKKQPKLTELENILEEAGNQKVVIWSPFPSQINLIYGHLEKLNIKSLKMYGATPVKARPHIVHQFQDPSGPRILIANPSVAGLGLNLTVSCLEVFMTNWFQPDIRNQAIDRLHRKGQTKPVTVIDLLAKGTIEPRILSSLAHKIDIEKQVIYMNHILGKEE